MMINNRGRGSKDGATGVRRAAEIGRRHRGEDGVASVVGPRHHARPPQDPCHGNGAAIDRPQRVCVDRLWTSAHEERGINAPRRSQRCAGDVCAF
jgi:hypothetical protein